MKLFIIVCIFAVGNIYGNPTNAINAFVQKQLKIIGGNEAKPHEYPYQVGLEIKDKYSFAFCGGSLISENYVLTSASCLQTAIVADVILGAHKIENSSEGTQLRLTSSEFTYHNEYDSTYLINDIGLIKLPTPVKENDYIKIVKLAHQGNDFSGEQGTVTGWGLTEDASSEICPALQFLTNEVLSNIQCKNIEPYDQVVQGTHVCLSGSGGRGACNGDTGGPLVSNGAQIGVYSFNYKYCDAGKPSVFTRVSEYKNWIKRHSDVKY